MLVVELTLFGGTYEASLGAGPEWPPHPGRLFSALVAQAAEGTADDEALEWLQGQALPVVLASAAKGSTMQAFVPTNAVGKADTHQTYLGRTAGSRTWHRAHPLADTVHMVWETAQPSAEVRSSLQRLCRRVPYLGRAASPVLVTLPDQIPDVAPRAATSRPVTDRCGCGCPARARLPTYAPRTRPASRLAASTDGCHTGSRWPWRSRCTRR